MHRAYQGCLQERRPISHSSCFDVRYRGPPVPLHALRHAQPFELTVCGKAAAAPRRVAPPPHAYLISFGACESGRCRRSEALGWFVRKKGLTSRGTRKKRLGGGGWGRQPTAESIVAWLCCQSADKIICCPSNATSRAAYLLQFQRALRGGKHLAASRSFSCFFN